MNEHLGSQGRKKQDEVDQTARDGTTVGQVGARGLHVRCPHCHNPIEIVDRDLLAAVTCPSCGDKFSIADEATLDWTGPEPIAPARHRKIGRFELVEQLGAGAFGAVWKARDAQLDRIVAVKIPRKGQLDATEAEQFLREARAAAQLQHPNIVSVHEVGVEGEVIYIVSDFVAGLPLSDWLENQKLTHREAAELCARVAMALQFAHDRGVIHRDLKPSNIIIDPAGEPHIMDFGLAKREAGEITMTVDGQVLGTPAYMSPEQARGEGHAADRRTDVYSLGVILYELLTGERPFRGNVRMLLRQVIDDDPPSLRKLDNRIPRDLNTICLKCLEKDPSRRYASAEAVADELRRWVRGSPIRARPVSLPERAWRWCKRHPLPAALAGLAAAALLAWGVYWQTRPAYLELRVRPDDARVLLDGEPVALFDGHALLRGGPGRHAVEVSAPDHVPYAQDAVLVRGRNKAAFLNVELRSVFGHVEAGSDPQGALVKLRDAAGRVVAEGTTPFRSSQVKAGEYVLAFSKDTYLPAEQSVTVPSGLRTVRVATQRLDLAVEGAESFERLGQIREKLGQPLEAGKDLEYLETPLKDVLVSMSRAWDVPILLDRRSLDEVGISRDTPVTFSVPGPVSLQAALELVLGQYGLTYVPQIEGPADARQYRLLVTSPEAAERHRPDVLHPVGDLTQGPGQVEGDALVKHIKYAIAPASWESVGGIGGARYLGVAGAISVQQSWKIQLQIDALLADIRRARAVNLKRLREARDAAGSDRAGRDTARPSSQAAPPAATRAGSLESLRQLRERLARPLREGRSLEFTRRPLGEALAEIGKTWSIPITIDRRTLDEVGLSSEVLITQSIPETTSLRAALGLVLRPLDLTFVPHVEGAEDNRRYLLTVITPSQAAIRQVLVLHPVADLTEGPDAIDGDELANWIAAGIQPASWQLAGGIGAVKYLAPARSLSVRHLWDVQFKIDEYLAKMREGVPPKPNDS